MNVNYDLLFQEAKSKAKEGSKLLLHVCCAPCATYCLTRLLDVFDITLYFSDDNIFPDAEWEKRLGEVKKLVDIVNNGQFEQKAKFPLKLHVKQYNYGNFLHCAKGLEKEREGAQGVKSALNCALTTLATLPTPTDSTTLPPLSPFPPTKTAKLSTPWEADLPKKRSGFAPTSKSTTVTTKACVCRKNTACTASTTADAPSPFNKCNGSKNKRTEKPPIFYLAVFTFFPLLFGSCCATALPCGIAFYLQYCFFYNFSGDG